jgi:DDE superfamily endonuclease
VTGVLRQSPRTLGLPRARWTLRLLAGVLLWLSGLSDSGVHRLLRRLELRYRRGQAHLHSPDPDYQAKLAAVARARREAAASSGRVVLLYEDELTYYRRPSVARCHQPRGGPGAYAEQGHRSNSKRRVVGALDACSGRLHYWQGSRAGQKELRRFFAHLSEAYSGADRIYVALDNWPVHFLPDVLDSLVGTPVQLLRLPTYAPWTNPVEKVWRKLKQELLHQHDYRDDWTGLQSAVEQWLQRSALDPDGLRRYTGLKHRKKRRQKSR